MTLNHLLVEISPLHMGTSVLLALAVCLYAFNLCVITCSLYLFLLSLSSSLLSLLSQYKLPVDYCCELVFKHESMERIPAEGALQKWKLKLKENICLRFEDYITASSAPVKPKKPSCLRLCWRFPLILVQRRNTLSYKNKGSSEKL